MAGKQRQIAGSRLHRGWAGGKHPAVVNQQHPRILETDVHRTLDALMRIVGKGNMDWILRGSPGWLHSSRHSSDQ